MACRKNRRRRIPGIEMLEGRLVPAQFTVTRADDDNTVPVAPVNLTLRQAIYLANQDTDPSSTIILQVTESQLTIANTAAGQDNTNKYGDLDLTQAGHTYIFQHQNAATQFTIRQTVNDRVFQLFPSVKVQFINATITGGAAVDDGTSGVQPGTTSALGGGILARAPQQDAGATVILQGSAVTANSATAGTNLNAQGGGIHIDLGNSKEAWLGVRLVNSSVTSNAVTAGNGGLGNFGGQGSGGGISLNEGQILAEGECEISNNTVTAGKGGGYQSGGTVNGLLGGSALGGGLFLAKGDLNINGQLAIKTNTATGGDGSNGTVVISGTELVGTGGGGGGSRGGGLYLGSGTIADGDGTANSLTVLGNKAQAGAAGSAVAAAGAPGAGGAGGDAQGGGAYLGQVSFTFQSAQSVFQDNTATGGAAGNGGNGGSVGGIGGAGGLARGGAVFGGDNLLSALDLTNFRFSSNKVTGGAGGTGGNGPTTGGKGGAGGDAQGGAIILSPFESTLTLVDTIFTANQATGGKGGTGGGPSSTAGYGGAGGTVIGGAIYANGKVVITGGALTDNSGTGGRGGDAGGGLGAGVAGKGGSVSGGVLAGGVLANNWQPTQRNGFIQITNAEINNNRAIGGVGGLSGGSSNPALIGESQGILQTILNGSGGYHQGMTLSGVTLMDNLCQGSTVTAGAINNGNGALSLTNCTITENTAISLGTDAAQKTAAAGVLFSSHRQPQGTFPAPTLNIAGTTISRNTTSSPNVGPVSQGAGLVIVPGGTVTLANPLIATVTNSFLLANNDISDKGGGLYLDFPQSQVTLVNTTVADNNGSDKYPLNVYKGATSTLTVKANTYVGSGPGTQAKIGVFDPSGGLIKVIQVFPGFTGGVNLSSAIDPATGHTFLAAGAGPGGGSSIQIVDVVTGLVVDSLTPFPGFNGPIFSALGDINNDGFLDVVVGAGQGGPPSVVIYNGQTKTYTRAFYAYDPRFKGGVRVALGDETGDGQLDVLTASGVGATPTVALFDSATNFSYIRGFFAYAPGFTSGIFISAADVSGDGIADIITGAGQGGPPNVVLFNQFGATMRSFYAFDSLFRGGVDVGATQPVGSALLSDLLAASGPGAPGSVAVFDGSNPMAFSPMLVYYTGADFSTNGIWVA